MVERTCCFTGHRILSLAERDYIQKRLSEEIDRLYKIGKNQFISGGAIGFDQIAAYVVLDKKKIYKDISLFMVLPFVGQEEKWNLKQKEAYEQLLPMADEVIYISESYNDYCIHGRNMYMVDASSVCICYLKYQRGGTFNTVKYALENDMDVINIASAKK